ncbi:hypothetical protein ACQKJC_11670 [Priestia koreensis]|uniref:hypothetical protein n=1 Tax=Priestia koreensis TaxID=284581 RepID=UPI003CFE7005
MKNFFFCYNKRVSDYLSYKGVRYITVAQDLKTQKVFSLYLINDEFQEAMNEYKQLNK